MPEDFLRAEIARFGSWTYPHPYASPVPCTCKVRWGDVAESEDKPETSEDFPRADLLARLALRYALMHPSRFCPCACKVRCGDVAEPDDRPEAVCKGLPRKEASRAGR